MVYMISRKTKIAIFFKNDLFLSLLDSQNGSVDHHLLDAVEHQLATAGLRYMSQYCHKFYEQHNMMRLLSAHYITFYELKPDSLS